MKFEYDKKQIEKVAKEQNYTANNVEKVIRLALILEDLNSLPAFRGKLLLKGGTAINLVAFENRLPRLSVDLDLDFAINLSKEEMLAEREKINASLDDYCRDNGYEKSGRNSFAQDSISLVYTTATGSKDKIKLDINYHNRCHIFEGAETLIPFPFSMEERTLPVAHLNTIELFAGKIKAFYERCKPRDIYDIYSLASSELFPSQEERDLLRKCIVFYSTLGNAGNRNLLRQDISRILEMPFQDIKTQLLPMLHINAGKYPKEEINKAVISFLSSLVQLDETEEEYLDKFYNGEYLPSLLFDEDTATRLLTHPVAIRTHRQIRENMEVKE